MKLLLASASPRRAELVQKLGIDFEIHPTSAEEVTLSDAEQTAVANARLKALSVKPEGCIVLGADTVVSSMDNKPIGKPHSEEEAFAMLRELCGRTHEVITAVYLTDGNKVAEAVEKTLVTFNPFNEDIVRAYIATGKPFDKAGGYGVQDKELADIVAKVTGDYDNVVGLPVKLVDELLRENFL